MTSEPQSDELVRPACPLFRIEDSLADAHGGKLEVLLIATGSEASLAVCREGSRREDPTASGRIASGIHRFYEERVASEAAVV